MRNGCQRSEMAVDGATRGGWCEVAVDGAKSRWTVRLAVYPLAVECQTARLRDNPTATPLKYVLALPGFDYHLSRFLLHYIPHRTSSTVPHSHRLHHTSLIATHSTTLSGLLPIAHHQSPTTPHHFPSSLWCSLFQNSLVP